ncbi:MAG: heme NO-binding domain-containing protein [Actinobacteria bacterium]|nr:heme NO-binding domain-containing protein [Actinomycetota bacterium]
MYGLVNRAVEDLVTNKFGPEAWAEVKSRAGVDVGMFVAMSPYPDAVTYSLVGAASEVLDLPAEQVLEAFGEYWMQYSAREGYGELLDLMGNDLPTFLAELDDVHERLKLSFPDLVPPSMTVSDVTDASLVVHYRSDRAGLAPFVVGLLRAAAARFGRTAEVTVTRSRDDGHDHEEFLVRYLDA